MIDINTIETISPYVDHNQAKAIVAIPGSTLSSLTQSLIEKSQILASSLNKTQLRDEFTTNDAVKLVNEASIDNDEHYDSHQIVLDKTVVDIARIMRNNIFLARSIVIPMVDKYTERLTEVVSAKCNRSSLALNIIEDRKRSILASPQLKSIVNDQKNRTVYDDILLPRHHKADVSVVELISLLTTGNRSFDEVITNWVAVNSLDETIKQVYNDLFIKSINPSKLFSKYINTIDYQTSIIALLLCWGLTKNVQENITLSLTEYKEQMEVFSAACCGMINQAISRYERGVKNKNLVLQYPANDRQFCFDKPELNCIMVDPETYTSFIEMGGRPEMIFGAYLVDRAVNIEAILADAPKYIKEYARQTARGRLTSLNNTLTIVKAELRNIAFDIVKDIDESNNDGGDEELTYEIEFTGNAHLEKASRYIQAINSKDIEDYYSLIRNFVCSCYFEGSMVNSLLSKIDSLDPNGNADINEMALVATTDLIVDWLLDQVESEPNTVSNEGYYVL